MHVANILFKNFLFPNQWLPVNSNASALGNSISYFSKCVPCKWWLIMPLIRKRGDALLSIKCKANLGRCCRIKTTAAHIFRKLMFYLVSSGRSSSPSGHQAPKLSNPESQKQSVRFLSGRRVCSSVKAQTTVCALCSELVDTHLTKKTLTGHKVHLIIYMCWVNETFMGRKHKLEFQSAGKMGIIKVLHFILKLQDAFSLLIWMEGTGKERSFQKRRVNFQRGCDYSVQFKYPHTMPVSLWLKKKGQHLALLAL